MSFFKKLFDFKNKDQSEKPAASLEATSVVISEMMKLLASDEYAFKIFAVDLLGAMRPRAIEVIPVLIQILKNICPDDKYYEFDIAVYNALKSITGLDFGYDGFKWEQWWLKQQK